VGAAGVDDRAGLAKLIVVLISGAGSNMRALVDAGVPVSAVISNQADASGLDVASARGIATRTVPHRGFSSRDAFDAALAEEIDRFSPRAVVLAGFMRILTPAFVRRYSGRMLNIHPSLLPAFPGLETHERALAAGVKLHGCTVHFVTPELDQGPIVIQAAVPVRSDDTPATLRQRVLKQEHIIYPRAVRWLVDGRMVIEQGVVRVTEENAAKNPQLLFCPD
jgi:phosphoribosylglycinamide formyltransferase 1